MNADGSETEKLTDNSAFEASPAWSPDGSRIALKRTATATPISTLWTRTAEILKIYRTTRPATSIRCGLPTDR